MQKHILSISIIAVDLIANFKVFVCLDKNETIARNCEPHNLPTFQMVFQSSTMIYPVVDANSTNPETKQQEAAQKYNKTRTISSSDFLKHNYLQVPSTWGNLSFTSYCFISTTSLLQDKTQLNKCKEHCSTVASKLQSCNFSSTKRSSK